MCTCKEDWSTNLGDNCFHCSEGQPPDHTCCRSGVPCHGTHPYGEWSVMGGWEEPSNETEVFPASSPVPPVLEALTNMCTCKEDWSTNLGDNCFHCSEGQPSDHTCC